MPAVKKINKQKLRARLAELQKLEEFFKIREGYVREWVAAGMAEREARHQSWEKTALLFLEPDLWTPRPDPRSPEATSAAAGGSGPAVGISLPATSELQAMLDVPVEVFKNKKSNPRKDILWVYENLTLKGVRAKDAPSGGAWGMLIWARRSTVNQTSFITGLLAKVIAKEDDDREARMLDDGRSAQELIEEIKRLGCDSVHTPRSQDLGREPGLPAQDAHAGIVQPEDAAEPLDLQQA